MSKAEQLIKSISDADEFEILEFNFNPCFEHLRALEKDLEEANNLINSVRKILASTIPEHGTKEALIQLRQYKKKKSV